jgi:hypothetical protein
LLAFISSIKGCNCNISFWIKERLINNVETIKLALVALISCSGLSQRTYGKMWTLISWLVCWQFSDNNDLGNTLKIYPKRKIRDLLINRKKIKSYWYFGPEDRWTYHCLFIINLLGWPFRTHWFRHNSTSKKRFLRCVCVCHCLCLYLC